MNPLLTIAGVILVLASAARGYRAVWQEEYEEAAGYAFLFLVGACFLVAAR